MQFPKNDHNFDTLFTKFNRHLLKLKGKVDERIEKS